MSIETPLFFEDWYRENYTISRSEWPDAHLHYRVVGAARGFWPNPLFDSEWYLRNNIDVAARGENPLLHFETFGVGEGRTPNQLFDTDWYLRSYPDVGKAGWNPLLHYLAKGEADGRKPNPIFDPLWYKNENPDLASSGIGPLRHFLLWGANEGRNPGPGFDTSWYRETYRDELVCGANPLGHYLYTGRFRNYSPGPWTVRPDNRVMSDGYATECDHMPSKKVPVGEHLEGQTNPVNLIYGDLSEQSQQNKVLLVGHVLGSRLFGGERSFLDMVSAARRVGYQPIVVLPLGDNEDYIAMLKAESCRIYSFDYSWWHSGAEPEQSIIDTFRSLISINEVSLVHVNTVVLREPVIAAKQLDVPSLVHAREVITHDVDLCDSIGEPAYKIVAWVAEHADYIAANSQHTAESYRAEGRTFLQPNIVDLAKFTLPRREASSKLTVALISSNLPKKGIYDFVEIALLLEGRNVPIELLLVGPENQFTNGIREDQESGAVPRSLRIVGYAEDTVDVYRSSDVVLSISRFQESFGRTVAEAMAAARVVVAYDWGAPTELITHGEDGFIVENANPLAVADLLVELYENRDRLDRVAERAASSIREKLAEEDYEFRLSQIYAFIASGAYRRDWFSGDPDPSIPRDFAAGVSSVSVVIPNFNYQEFLPERIQSILAQSYPISEIIFLDDASEDDSVEVATALLQASGVTHQIIANAENQGVYRQWIRGVAEARGDYIWIAEADDSCAPTFLAELMVRVREEGCVMAYSQSSQVDENGDVMRPLNLHHTDDLSKERWLKDYCEMGRREVLDWIIYRNTIPNVSACLFDGKALKNSVKATAEWRYCGDWAMYIELLQHGNIAYASRPLNRFRRHTRSLTRSRGKDRDYFKELIAVKELVLENYPLTRTQLNKMTAFLNRDYRFEGITDVRDTAEYKALEKAIESRDGGGASRILFLTTNNGSYNGGSEVLWREAAEKLSSLGHDVVIAIKKWQPAPEFFYAFEKLGIKVLFKEALSDTALRDFAPDLVVVSTGCQDEGTEWFGRFRALNIPYVIVNQLTKPLDIWPTPAMKMDRVREGYLGAREVFFTCENNRRLMEARIQKRLKNYSIHRNPFHFDREYHPDFPSIENGLKIAVPARLLLIHKGQDVILKMLAYPEWRARRVEITFFGDGPDKEALERMADDLKLTNVRFVARVPDVRTIWTDHHVILMSSHMEGLPIVLIGAMMCGRVPVLTDVGGHAEAVEDGVSGFIAKYADPTSLSEALERAYKSRLSLEKIGARARKRALELIPEDPTGEFVDSLLRVCE